MEHQNDLGEIRFLGDMPRLQLQPGDMYVLTSESLLSVDQVRRLREDWRSVMGEAPLLVLSGGLRLGVVSHSNASI